MAAKYWIKLYHEILHDPKMGRLPDNLWRRAIELFLLAGELSADTEDDQKGILPPTDEIAWLLRQPESALEIELSRLAEIGILTKTDAGWIVTNFAKRQAPTETIDRVRQYRERQRKQAGNKKATDIDNSSYAKVTKSYIESDTDTESDIDSKEGAAAPTADKSKKANPQKKSKEQTDIPAAVKVYQDIARRLPDKALWPEIELKVGDTPECLERWGKVITAYIGCGWNKLNLGGMIRFYEENRIPSTEPVGKNGAYTNGHKQPTEKPDLTNPDTWAAQLEAASGKRTS